MILILERLRANYKAYRKIDPLIAEKIDMLISITKFDLEFTSEDQEQIKQKKVNAFLTGLELPYNVGKKHTARKETQKAWERRLPEGGPLAKYHYIFKA